MSQGQQSGAAGRGRRRQRRGAGRPVAARDDIWRAHPPVPEVEPIHEPREVGALLKSLGEPPLHNGAAAQLFFTNAVERSAAVALALTLAADVLAQD
ncbi:MAG: hypothetical protein RLZ04_2580 [Actinomycetota bacterium]|jgi:hypothetical protein